MRTALSLCTLSASFLMATATLIAQQPNPPLVDLKAAAEAGDPSAQDQLGDVYRKHGDPEDAVTWYRRSAPSGVINSQYQLAHILLTWAHSPFATKAVSAMHADEAIPFLLKAAAQGHKRAQLELGQLHREAKFVRQDTPEAYKWFCLASAHDGGLLDLASSAATTYRDSLILKMTQEQITEGNQRIARFQAHPEEPAPVPEPACFEQLKLQGVTGTPDHRLAIINGKTLALNESTTIKIDSRPLTIHCLNISPNSVTVAIAGFPAPKKLNLP